MAPRPTNNQTVVSQVLIPNSRGAIYAAASDQICVCFTVTFHTCAPAMASDDEHEWELRIYKRVARFESMQRGGALSMLGDTGDNLSRRPRGSGQLDRRGLWECTFASALAGRSLIPWPHASARGQGIRGLQRMQTQTNISRMPLRDRGGRTDESVGICS